MTIRLAKSAFCIGLLACLMACGACLAFADDSSQEAADPAYKNMLDNPKKVVYANNQVAYYNIAKKGGHKFVQAAYVDANKDGKYQAGEKAQVVGFKAYPKSQTAYFKYKGLRYYTRDVENRDNKNGDFLKQTYKGNKTKTVILPRQVIKVKGGFEPGSNTTINATGATIKGTKKKINLIKLNSANGKKPIKNVKFKGGTWQTAEKNGSTSSSTFSVVCAKNITFDHMKVNCSSQYYCMQIFGSSHVKVTNCKITAAGSWKKTYLKGAIRIDSSFGLSKKADKKRPCTHITIANNTILGNSAISVNQWDPNYTGVYHKKITIKNNKLTAKGSGAPCINMSNAAGFTITGNTIKSKSGNGIEVGNYGKRSSAYAKSTGTISKNTIKAKKRSIAPTTWAKSVKAKKLVISHNKMKKVSKAQMHKIARSVTIKK
ncbi:MAG: hypothetical protein ACOX1O_03480 [Eggerthellaceae bacterium]|jgi:hypothetical protein